MSLHNLNWIDYTIFGIIVFSTIISLIRGFVRESLSLATWLIAFFIAYKFAGPLSEQYLSAVQSEMLRLMIVFLILFFAILILGAIISYLICQIVNKSGLTSTDRALGLVFGVARGILLIAVLVLLSNMTAVTKNTWWADSQMIPKFQGLADWLQASLPNEFERLNTMRENANTAEKNAQQTAQQQIPDSTTATESVSQAPSSAETIPQPQ